MSLLVSILDGLGIVLLSLLTLLLLPADNKK